MLNEQNTQVYISSCDNKPKFKKNRSLYNYMNMETWKMFRNA